MSILVINAGSSSLKFGLFDGNTYESPASGLIDWAADPRQADFIILSGDAEEVRSQVEVPDYSSAVCNGLECLGLILDSRHNASCQPDTNIATHDSPAQILVIHTREDLMIAREAGRITQ